MNGINITQMNHIEIVKLIKESGNSITLTIGPPLTTIDESVNIQYNNKLNMEYNSNNTTNGKMNGFVNGRPVISQTTLQQQTVSSLLYT